MEGVRLEEKGAMPKRKGGLVIILCPLNPENWLGKKSESEPWNLQGGSHKL